MSTTVVLGAIWGDEGKGKLVDILCDSVDICARCQGGNNAGHTIVANGITYDFHILPSGKINDPLPCNCNTHLLFSNQQYNPMASLQPNTNSHSFALGIGY